MDAAALIVAAGRGQRAGGDVPKQFRFLGDRSVLRWSVDTLRAHPGVGVIAVAVDADDMARTAALLDGVSGLHLVSGGSTRTDSVRAGLDALAPFGPDVVLIHDAARPGLTAGILDRLLAALVGADAVAPALSVADALKRSGADDRVDEDLSRAGLRRVQTPQAFRFAPLHAAYASLDPGVAFDDDLAVARAAGMCTRLIEGDERLMKITWPADHARAEDLLVRFAPCVGTGFDAHRFGPGDHVTLCGVRISHERSLVGQSDADAGWHALTDALLGAIGAGDIGDHFPPTDPQWRGAASEVFLAHAVHLVREAGGRVVNVDITLICERPRIGPHREAMRARTAEVLGLPAARVSVKATTTERLGFTGREEGLAAQATASVLLPSV